MNMDDKRGMSDNFDKSRELRITYSGPLSGHTGTLPYDVLETGKEREREVVLHRLGEDIDNFDSACRVCQ